MIARESMLVSVLEQNLEQNIYLHVMPEFIHYVAMTVRAWNRV